MSRDEARLASDLRMICALCISSCLSSTTLWMLRTLSDGDSLGHVAVGLGVVVLVAMTGCVSWSPATSRYGLDFLYQRWTNAAPQPTTQTAPNTMARMTQGLLPMGVEEGASPGAASVSVFKGAIVFVS